MAIRPAKKAASSASSPTPSFAALLEDPSTPELQVNHAFNAEADHLHRNASLRFEIRDETIDGEPLYDVVDLNQAPCTWEDFEKRHGGGPTALQKILRDPQFHQINLFSICDHALSFIEEELGDEIVWPGKRPLILRPHAFEEANAYYDPADDSLSFGYFNTPLERDTVWTCLSHDIVTHELGHAILSALRPLFDIGIQPESSAFHEAFGDLIALFSAFEHEAVLERALGHGGTLHDPQGLASLASQMGSALYGFGHPYLRSALNKRYYDPTVLEPHDASEVLTGALYEAIARIAHHIHSKGKLSYVQAAKQAARWVRGMFLRAINYMPPTGVSLPQFAQLMLKADEHIFPGDGEHSDVRKLLKESFKESGLRDTKHDFDVPPSLAKLCLADNTEEKAKTNAKAETKPKSIQGSQGLSAYLLQHRDPSWLPDDAIFNRAWLIRSERNIDSEKPGDQQKKKILQTYLHYTYHLHIDGEQVTFGGTIVFDEKGDPQLWSSDPQPVRLAGKQQQSVSTAIDDHIAYLNVLWEQERYETLLAMADAWLEGGDDTDALDGARGTHVPRDMGHLPRRATSVPRVPPNGSCRCCGTRLRGTHVPRGAGGVPRGAAGQLPRGRGNLVRGAGHVVRGAGPIPRGAGPVPRGAGPVPRGAGPVPRGAGPVPRGAGPVPRGRGRVRPSIALFAALQRRRK